MLLFANYKTTVITDPKTNKKVGTGGERVMYTSHTPSWDAKNRFDLPSELPFEYKSIEHIFFEPHVAKDMPIDLGIPKDTIYESVPPLAALHKNMEQYKVTEEELLEWAKNNNGIQANSLDELDVNFINFINENYKAVYSKIVDEIRNPLG